MQSPALSRGRRAPCWRGVRRSTHRALVGLRGRDADGRLREIGAARVAVRPVLGALARALVEGRAHEALGYRCLGDYARERLGMGARAVREWARVWRQLDALPRLRGAVLSGEVSFSVARRIVGLVTPESEEACLESVRGRTVRAVDAMLRAARAAEASQAADGSPTPIAGEESRVCVRLPCGAREAVLWRAAVELARRTAGEALPVWQCAERIAAEAGSRIGGPADGAGEIAGVPASRGPHASDEPGPREQAYPDVSWRVLSGTVPAEIEALARDLDSADAREIDRRLRAAIGFRQSVDFETGRLLRQMVDRRLFAELGFPSLGRYAEERLDLAPRTARRLVSLARVEHRAPPVAHAFREGRIHAFQAHAVAPVADLANARAWVARAEAVTLRRLEDDLEGQRPGAIVFHAPPEVASLFLAMLARVGSLERLLAHAIATWVADGERFRDYADFRRDGFRCTVPGCTARRNLQSHHVRFRSAGGPDVPWNRTTLCAHHHLRGVHAGIVRIRGRAPDGLVFAFGGERYRSGDVRIASRTSSFSGKRPLSCFEKTCWPSAATSKMPPPPWISSTSAPKASIRAASRLEARGL
jgi:hypothetical protein